MIRKKLTEKNYKKLLRKRTTKKLTKRESKKLNDELDRRYNMCINKLRNKYKGDDIYAICNYSVKSRKNIKTKIKYL